LPREKTLLGLDTSFGEFCIINWYNNVSRNDMHTFTKQQRQGGGKYAARTLIGNWSEDVDLQAASLKQFMQKRETGSLKLDR
jgi:hypothetical protein